MFNIIPIALTTLLLASCEHYNPSNNPITYGDAYLKVDVNTDKSCYKPGEVVNFKLKHAIEGQSDFMVRIKHLNDSITDMPVSGLEWSWTVPATDMTGYLADLHKVINGKDSVFTSIAIDVSSDPRKFVRNGFLSSYGNISESEIENVMYNLRRYHINYLQFQDWICDHHKPLATKEDGTPADKWLDIASRENWRTTVLSYINKAHAAGMKTLSYDLCYGALQNAAQDGVQEEWYLFKDDALTEKKSHKLSAPFKSSIYLVNPDNTEWQSYLANQMDAMYAAYPFDGYQIDQLGNLGEIYGYPKKSGDKGTKITSSAMYKGFKNFIIKMKDSKPEKSLVMNAVSQFGQQQGIAQAKIGDDIIVDFLYTEVWPNDNGTTYSDLVDVIQTNDKISKNQRSTVLAAYLNYNMGGSPGYFNTPGVLMTTAVAQAFGGTILQMGEHMLCTEYFPNGNLQMEADLKHAIIHYYDFLVGYENALRGGGEWVSTDIQTTADGITFQQWPVSATNQIAVQGKKVGTTDYIHLLNYMGASHLDWCDTDGSQSEPKLIQELPISIGVSAQPKNVWFASPDYKSGVSQKLEFTYENGKVSFTLPSLKYWDMIAIEYQKN